MSHTCSKSISLSKRYLTVKIHPVITYAISCFLLIQTQLSGADSLPANLRLWKNMTSVGALNSQIESSELLNYLISDVCTDSTGEPIAGDPFSCTRKRNIEIG
ncbi:MAG: hypothetical protein AB7H97_20260, partial [Pseudobdellovibrionaceae bacterium]